MFFSRLNGGLRFLNADFCQYCVGNVSWPWWRTDKPATNEHIWADDENHFELRAPTFEPLCLLGCLWAISETRLRISNPFQFKTWGRVASDLESYHQRNLPDAAFKSAPLEHPNEVVLANMWNIILPSKWISQGLLQSGLLPPHPMLNSLDMGNADNSTELHAQRNAEQHTICNADCPPSVENFHIRMQSWQCTMHIAH